MYIGFASGALYKTRVPQKTGAIQMEKSTRNRNKEPHMCLSKCQNLLMLITGDNRRAKDSQHVLEGIRISLCQGFNNVATKKVLDIILLQG